MNAALAQAAALLQEQAAMWATLAQEWRDRGLVFSAPYGQAEAARAARIARDLVSLKHPVSA